MKPLLPDLINYDQTGFIRGRFIGENIRLIDSVICYAKENNIPGLLLFLDFEKAFDTIEWPFIRKTFQHFGFGKLPSHNQQKWLKDCNENDVEAINWREAYQLAAKYTKSTRIIEFQYKFLHRRISTNDFLTKIGVKDNPNCSFCNNEPEKLLHLFWSCPKVAFFWHSLSLKLTLLHITPEHSTLDIFVALGLKPDSSKNCQQINFLFLLARNYVWISKRRETSPKIAGFLQYLKSFYYIETTAGPILPKKWENVSSLFQ